MLNTGTYTGDESENTDSEDGLDEEEKEFTEKL